MGNSWHKFTPVLSGALPEDEWQGRIGFVHEAVLADYSDLSGYQVYACGAPVVVERSAPRLHNLVRIAQRGILLRRGLLLQLKYDFRRFHGLAINPCLNLFVF